MTLLERKDGDRDTSYVELAEFLANHGAKGAVDADLAQLFRRVVFNVMAANRDDHLRNHGFLLTSTGWRLSPAFDVNPNPAKSEHALRLDEGSPLPHLDLVLRTAPYYRLRTDDAVRIVNDVRVQVARWREVAAQVGVPAREIERMDNVIMVN
jgi:serine/threonine-protein kinase HipA